MDFFKKYKKEICISLVTSTFVGFGNRNPVLKVLSQEQVKKVKKIVPKIENNHLTILSIIDIQSLIIGASFIDVGKLIEAHRRERRKCLNDLKAYINHSRLYEQREAEIIQPIQDDVFAILKISPELWEESNKYHLEESKDEYLSSLSGLTNQLKALRARQIIDTDKLVNVINDIETILEDNEGTLVDMAEMIGTSLSIATMENWIYDKLHEIYEDIEEEDFIKSIQEHIEDPLIKSEFDRVSKKIIQFTRPNTING